MHRLQLHTAQRPCTNTWFRDGEFMMKTWVHVFMQITITTGQSDKRRWKPWFMMVGGDESDVWEAFIIDNIDNPSRESERLWKVAKLLYGANNPAESQFSSINLKYYNLWYYSWQELGKSSPFHCKSLKAPSWLLYCWLIMQGPIHLCWLASDVTENILFAKVMRCECTAHGGRAVRSAIPGRGATRWEDNHLLPSGPTDGC